MIKKSAKRKTLTPPFPYINDMLDVGYITQRFQNLKRFRPCLYEGNYNIRNLYGVNLKFYGDELGEPGMKLIGYCPTNYKKFDKISPYFIDDLIVQSKRNGCDRSPLELWDNPAFRKKITEHAEIKYGRTDPYVLRESIHDLVHEVGTFRPTNVVSIVKLFFPNDQIDILDPCAGWGDRLIGALACDNVKSYTGVDPNDLLHPRYEQMRLLFGNNKHCEFINSPFEDACLDEKLFDLVMTSPPYFDLEVYNDDPDQSISRYPEIQDWLEYFLFVALEKMVSHLKSGGLLVININDSKDAPISIVKEMLKFMCKMTNVEYLGVLSFSEMIKGKPKSPQPMFIWRKV